MLPNTSRSLGYCYLRGQIEKVWWKMMQLQFYNLQHLIVNQKKIDKIYQFAQQKGSTASIVKESDSMLSLLKLFLISKTQLMPKASKRLFNKSYYISSILKWIWLIFCKIKNIFMHFKFISHLGYYIQDMLLYSIWKIGPNLMNI